MSLLDDYVKRKTGFEYQEIATYSNIKYKKDDILIIPYKKQKFTYRILGFLRYTKSSYLRYVGELKNNEGDYCIVTSRDIKEVDADYKVSITSILKQL